MLSSAVHCSSIRILVFEACIIDYFPKWRTPKVRSALIWLLRSATVLVGISLYELETNDVGITGAVAKIWKA